MKTSSAKAKGRKLQQDICRKIANIFNIEYDQQDDTCPIHSREMGQAGTDVVIRSKELLEKFPFSIECKRTETVSLYKNIEQASANVLKNTDWLLIHRKNRSNPIVIMDWETFEKLIRKGVNHDT